MSEKTIGQLVRMLGSIGARTKCDIEVAAGFTDDDGAWQQRRKPMVTITFFAHRYSKSKDHEASFHDVPKKESANA